jgi:hypothetical protein
VIGGQILQPVAIDYRLERLCNLIHCFWRKSSCVE